MLDGGRKTKIAILRKTSIQRSDPENTKTKKEKEANENMAETERWSEKEHVLEGGK